MIDRASGVPVYRQVASDLRSKIEHGAFEDGQVPSERELVDTYGVSRVTIREAIKLLRSEGLVSAEHGRGVFVRPKHVVRRLARNRSSREARDRNQAFFLGDAQAAGFKPDVRTSLRTEQATDDIAETLHIDAGDEVFVRDRIMFADHRPVQLAVSRLPRDLTRGTRIEQADTGAGGIYARLEESGHKIDRYLETVTTRMPTPKEMSELQLALGTPVLLIRRIAYAANGVPVEVNDMTVPGDRYELAYELPAD